MAVLPNPNALRRRTPLLVDRVLPAAGRPGAPPAWPGRTKATPAERAKWVQLWKLPQAAAWEQLHMHDVVFNYCRLFVTLHADLDAGEPKAAMATVVQKMSERLGMDSASLIRLRWQIEGSEQERPSHRRGQLGDVMTLKVAPPDNVPDDELTPGELRARRGRTPVRQRIRAIDPTPITEGVPK